MQPTRLTAGRSATIYCSGKDSDGSVVSADYYFGDGSTGRADKDVGGSGTITTTHRFTRAGTYTVTCRVRDNSGAISDMPSICSTKYTVVAAPTAKPITATSTPMATVTKAASISAMPTFSFVDLSTITPSVQPSPTGIPAEILLTVSPFTNAQGYASATFTMRGTTEPNTQVDVVIDPDGVRGTVVADAKGAWKYVVTRALTAGSKIATVVAVSDNGRSEQKITFSVGRGTPNLGGVFMGIGAIILLGVVGFVVYRRLNEG